MSSPSLSPPITTPSSKRIAAVINHHHPHTPPPLTLIGANIRPDHNLSSSSSASSLASSLSAIPITSGPPLSSSSASTDSHHLDLPRSHSKDLLTVAAEADDVFLPLQSSADFTFPINSSDASGSQRAQHARRHSRVHSRNLSVFFPRPGQHSTLPVSPHTPTQVVEIPPAKVTSESSHLAHTPTSATTSADLNTPASSRAKGRRGHHHRHSLSHNFFPFLHEPGLASAHSHTTSPSCSPCPPTPASAIPKAVPSSVRQHGHLPAAGTTDDRRRRQSQLPPGAQPLRIALAITTGLLGARLWLSGQLALVGVGYLVVCEALGVGWAVYESVVAQRPNRRESLRQPYGTVRHLTLARFTRAVYLLFAAMYVCKEAIEQVVLESGSEASVGPDVYIDQFLLSLAIVSIGCSAVTIGDDRGGGFRRLYTLAFSTVLGLATVYATHAEQAAIGRVVGLLEVLAMVSLGLPEAMTTGKILLQTSPDKREFAREMNIFKSGLDFIDRNEANVLAVKSNKVWRLAADEKRLVSSVQLNVKEISGLEAVSLVAGARAALGGVGDELTIELVSST